MKVDEDIRGIIRTKVIIIPLDIFHKIHLKKMSKIM